MITMPRIAAALFITLFCFPVSEAEASDWQARLHGQWVSSSGEFFAGQGFDGEGAKILDGILFPPRTVAGDRNLTG